MSGLQTLAGDPVEIEHNARVEPAAAALINQRRIGEAVAENDAARGSSAGRITSIHILRAAREVEQQFGARLDGGVGGIEQDAPDLLPDLRAAGLDRFNNLTAARRRRLREQPQLRGLAAAVHAFESDKVAPCCRNGRHQLFRLLLRRGFAHQRIVHRGGFLPVMNVNPHPLIRIIRLAAAGSVLIGDSRNCIACGRGRHACIYSRPYRRLPDRAQSTPPQTDLRRRWRADPVPAATPQTGYSSNNTAPAPYEWS